jgi:hypothetical protein
LRLSEKSVTGQTTTIYSVHKEQYTLYVVYYEAKKHFPDSLVDIHLDNPHGVILPDILFYTILQ